MTIMAPSSAGSGEHQTGGGGGSQEGSFQWSSAAATGSRPTQDDALEGTKVRKPYTITKQRERWTGEEHQKFLEALKLYSRAWRKIEEHIGTKTAVQIRSHAQKFFSKVERDQAVPGGMDTGMVQPLIDIPPPRPKRKPSHPYPRKAKGSNVSKHSEDDTPVASSSLGRPATARPEDTFVKSARQEDDVTEVHKEISPDSQPKEEISGEDKLPAVTPIQVLSEPPWVVPFPAFHHYPQWGNYLQNQLRDCNQQPAYGNFEKMAQLATLFMSRGVTLPWHPSQVTLTSCGPQDASAVSYTPSEIAGFLPAITSGMSTTTITASGISEFGSHNLLRGTVVPEDEAAASARATMAAASAWWALQNGPSPLSLAAMRALYNPPMATMPSPFLFSQGKILQHDAKLKDPEPEGEVPPQLQALEESCQELVVHSGDELVRSNAAQMAEEPMQVKGATAKRDVATGSCGGSSNLCMSSSWGESWLKPRNGGGRSKEFQQRVELVNHSGDENICRNPSNAGSSPTKLHKLKSQLTGLVQKELSSKHARSSKDEGDEVGYENWKHLRDEAFSDLSMVPITCSSSKRGVCVPPALQLLKSGDVSASDCFPAMYTNEAPYQKSSEKHTTALQTCSDSEVSGSNGGMLADNGSGEGGDPSSNSSACGNPPGRNGHSGSSDGSSDVEAPSNVPSNCREETNEQSSSETEIVETAAEEAQVGFRCFSHDDLTSFRMDSERRPQECTFRLLPRSMSLEGEQQKEAMGRSQVAFQALFARETLPRTFSPPPRDSLATGRAPTSDSGFVDQALSLCLQSRISHSKHLSSVSSPADEGQPCHPHTPCAADQDSAFNGWQPYKALKGSGIKLDRSENSSIMTSSGAQVSQRPEDHWSPKQTKDIKRKEGHGEGATINWLTLGTESSGLEVVKDDSEDTDFESQHESLHTETSTPNVDFFPPLKKRKFIASSNEVDDAGSSLLTLPLSSEPLSGKTHMFSLSIATSRSGLSTVSSTRSVKYSGLGFVPYQRASSESSLQL